MSKTEQAETYIVTYFDDEGREYDQEYETLEDAIQGLVDKMGVYETFSGGSINSLMATPSLYHPDGSGREWCLDTNAWV